MRQALLTAAGVVGSLIAAAFGGWSGGITALVVFMGVDYATGLAAAGIFHASRKTPGGGLESRAGWKGLVRKGVTLLIVLAACRLDLLLGVTYVRDAAVIGFCVNELLSIVENAAAMGVPIPAPLARSIEALRQHAEDAPGAEGGHE